MKTIAKLYAEARRAGYHAVGAIRAARIVAEFDEAESADLVRIVAESEQEG